ncbi:MAG: TonB family protein [Sphingobium sp.]|nr:TonB family protein [Sphingobium sp.]
MTQLSLAQPGTRSRYAGQSQRSPKIFAAALAINGGVFALILALPGVQQVLRNPDPPLTTWNVPIEQDPPPVTTEPVKKDPIHTPNTTQAKDDPLSFIPPPIMPLGATSELTGSREVMPLPVDPVRPIPPVHVPVFQTAIRDPRFADAFHPAYPPALQREGLEGSVTVRVTIDEKGRVTACELVKATNKAFFEETREQALKRWRFRPATSDGVPVVSQQTLTVTFQLEA